MTLKKVIMAQRHARNGQTKHFVKFVKQIVNIFYNFPSRPLNYRSGWIKTYLVWILNICCIILYIMFKYINKTEEEMLSYQMKLSKYAIH